jgi:hypothetical protein
VTVGRSRGLLRPCAMRWRCPPLNSWGCRVPALGCKPTKRSSSYTRSWTSRHAIRVLTTSGSPTIVGIHLEQHAVTRANTPTEG